MVCLVHWQCAQVAYSMMITTSQALEITLCGKYLIMSHLAGGLVRDSLILINTGVGGERMQHGCTSTFEALAGWCGLQLP